MRRFEKGAVHALTALERGLKYCADHPKLVALKREMSAMFEERTSPRITPALLKTAGKEGAAAALEEGRSLYVNRCTECHELELLDSRTVSAWRDAVAGMARRANLDGGQQARIVEYLTVAQRGMSAED
jgi:cytochrome c1